MLPKIDKHNLPAKVRRRQNSPAQVCEFEVWQTRVNFADNGRGFFRLSETCRAVVTPGKPTRGDAQEW
jgi:hypothetical protein